MFGETHSESPRLPSPWLSRSSGGTTPSPFALATPDSTTTPGRRRSSLEALELLDGLAEDFDAIALGRGKLSASPAMEEIAVREVGMDTLEPEVDHQGHIEYKLKLLTPTSLHRLEKLRTQLKWRLVEGGGLAVYELGVLDDGTLVGLAQADMDESRRTLGQMLAGLGGGDVQVTRVVRLGGGSSGASPSAESSSSSSPSASPGALFPSFAVPYDTDDLAFITTPSLLSSTSPAVNDPAADATLPTPPRSRGPTPFPSNRTPDEQAEMRRLKRDARRAQRREADCNGNAGGGTSPRAFSAAWPARIPPREKAHKPPRPPRASPGSRSGSSSASSEGDAPAPSPKAPSAPKSPPGGESLYKPLLLKEGDTEVRYVVEAVVIKAGGATPPEGGRRRKSSAARAAQAADELATLEIFAAGEEDDEEEDSDSDEAVADGDEGWSFLEFDLGRLSTSVKTAAAAAAAAEGRAPPPIATATAQA